MTVGTVATLAILTAAAIVLGALSIRVVKQHERMVVFRLGRTGAELVRGPGLRFIIPFVDRPVRVDMREQVIEVASRSTATSDRQMVDLDARIEYRTADPLAMILAVEDLRDSLTAHTVGILSELIAESTSEDVRFGRESLARDVRDRLDAEVEPWGVAITDVGLS